MVLQFKDMEHRPSDLRHLLLCWGMTVVDQIHELTDSDHESIGHAILASMRLNANVQWEPELVRSDFTLCGHSLSVSRLSEEIDKK